MLTSTPRSGNIEPKERSDMNLRFWGVRGSIPTPEPDRLRFGGNTTCLEICASGLDEPVIIDCGSGIRTLGDKLASLGARRIHILLTHFHWDHIQGLPSFAPLFQPGVEIVFYTSRTFDEARTLFGVQMDDPFFPVPFDEASARIDLQQVQCGKEFQIGSLKIEPFQLNHPQGAVGFRAESCGQVLVHASDHESGVPEIDAGLIRAARGADLLVMDAQYTPEEYLTKVGWGHSSYAHVTDAARSAGVGRLLLFHHDPAHDDRFLDRMLADAQELFAATGMACEGSVIEIG